MWKWLDVKGRASRLELCAVWAGLLLVNATLYVIIGSIAPNGVDGWWTLPSLMVAMAPAVIMLISGIRRFHDIGISVVWVLAAMLAISAVGLAFEESGAANAETWTIGIETAAFVLVLFLVPGQSPDNRWGPRARFRARSAVRAEVGPAAS
jgi:uncharacterized membrane protein YhaH (DUF805 family)